MSKSPKDERIEGSDKNNSYEDKEWTNILGDIEFDTMFEVD